MGQQMKLTDMTEYNEKIVRADSDMFLDDTQRSYLEFEENALVNKFQTYLEKTKKEEEMQYFFEVNPILLPGLYDLHNGPVGDIVISKLKLSDEYVTDFAFISCNSAVAQITLIEIESPSIEVFRNSDEEFSSSFNKAYQQVRDWELWADQNGAYIKDMFRKMYHHGIFRYQKVVTRRILIAGRRLEIQKSPRREKRWTSINQNPSTAVMTYDRLVDILTFNTRLLQKLTCRSARDVHRSFRAKSR